MRKRIKIWFHSGSTSAIREISFHRAGFVLLIGLCVCVLAGVGFMGYDYARLKKISYNNELLTVEIDKKTIEIHNQRSQIQQFSKEINILKKQVRNLFEFEDKVRLIADIGPAGDSSGLIGIGGIPADELDEDVALDQKHNSLIREMHQQVGQVNLIVENQSRNFEDLIKLLETKKNLLASTPSVRPVDGWITSNFGYRVSPFTGQKEFHSGLDISNKKGTKIISTAQGKVTFAGSKSFFGNLITIDHGYGRVTKYAHLDKMFVEKGQKVKRGDVIGTVGVSGRTTGPHLHYEVRINGTPENPLKYILN
jgi:murein DD-endopeptidase MepM/ murein hydrolase activator NlpD